MKAKDIKDYIHLYLGCEIYWNEEYGSETLTAEVLHTIDYDNLYAGVKLILRPLSSMTEEEDKVCDDLSGGIFTTFTSRAAEIRYLLSKHFDIFGLIDSGLAIEDKQIVK